MLFLYYYINILLTLAYNIGSSCFNLTLQKYEYNISTRYWEAISYQNYAYI